MNNHLTDVTFAPFGAGNPGTLRMSNAAFEQSIITKLEGLKTTGYPFMQLARRHGLDYGDVLTTADYVTQRFKFQPHDFSFVTPHMRSALARVHTHALADIVALCRLPVAERGQ